MFVVGIMNTRDAGSFELVQGEIIDKYEHEKEDNFVETVLLLSDDAIVIEYAEFNENILIIEHRKGSVNFKDDEKVIENNSVNEIRCPHCNKVLGYKSRGFLQTKCLRCKNVVRFW